MPSSLQHFQAVLFDFDGTLADSYRAIAASVNHVRAQHGLAPLSVAEINRFVGLGPDHLLANTVPVGEVAANLTCYRAHHPTVMMPLTELLPGAAALLAGLQRTGKRVGLCSNKPRMFSQRLLDHLQVLPFFDLVLGPEDVRRPKPAPDMLLAALERLQLKAADVLYVGDMTVDIETARAAGVPVWVVPTGSSEREVLVEARPDRLLADLGEMVAELAG
jgi:2-phosphoglycolate phosphatase